MRIVVAMSGGVDSSVAAALLRRQGYDVIGVSMQIWGDYTIPGARSCCSPSHLDDARAVCEQLGIPYYAVNYHKEFEDKVIDGFCKEYLAGRTPSPCIPCNHELKFKTLWDKAKTLGAEYLATGHYARIARDGKDKRLYIKTGLDKTKDQSYFLFSLSQDMLAHTLFPLGELEKAEVRELAREFGLAVASKSESQEICFIPESGYREFLKKRCPGQIIKGDFLNTKGEKIGEHQGIAMYTVGQRRGLGLSSLRPLYVVKLDAENNTITVGGEKDLYQPCLLATGVNLYNLIGPLKVQARIRYRHRPADATVSPVGDKKVLVEFSQPQKAVTPGQAVVFYQRDTVLGGGWIERGGEKERICKKN